ncbi:MAG: hypothetical protein L0212_03130, partial [Acidobacteria bacterium]|nr:hypothetical protein [Acidobacteriota bacterium]
MEVWREPRIPMQLRVELHGLGPSGPFQENAYTVNVSRSGARLVGSRYSQHPGDTVELRRGKDKARFQVIWVGEPGTPVHGQVGVRSLEPAKNIWSAPLPPPKPVAHLSAPSRPSLSAFSEAAFSPSVEPSPAPPDAVGAADASGESLYTRTPFVAAADENAPGAPAEGQGDTVSYGPQLLPESYITASTPLPLHKRPILYIGLAVALIAGLGLGWLRSRSTPDETASAVSSAEASSPTTSSAPTTSRTSSSAPTQPAAQPPLTTPTQSSASQTQPVTKPTPKKETAASPPAKPAQTMLGAKPVETASRTQPVATKPAPITSGSA